MNYTLIVLLAGLWSTGVFAAPSTPNFSFQEYTSEHTVFSDFGKNLERSWEIVKCVRNVIAQVVVESEFKGLWDQTKAEIENLVTVEFPKCAEINDVAEQTNCTAVVVIKGVETLSTFVKALVAANKWEFVKEIEEKVVAKCFQPQTELFGFKDKRHNPLFEHLECVADLLESVSKAHGLDHLWSKSKSQLQNHFQKYEKCKYAGDELDVAVCRAREIGHSVTFIREYVKLAADSDPTFSKDFGKQYNETCVSIEIGELSASLGFKDEAEQFHDTFLTQFECLANVLDIVSKTNGLDDLWSKSQPQLQHHLGKWKQCDQAGNAIFVSFCKLREGAVSFRIVSEYVKLAVASDRNFVQDFKKQYEKSCADKSQIDELTEMFVVEGVEACVQKFVDKVKCVSGAISEAVENTEFQDAWKALEEDVSNLENQLAACKNEPCKWTAAKCITKGLMKTYHIFGEFLFKLNLANHEAYVKVKENIKNKCYTI